MGACLVRLRRTAIICLGWNATRPKGWARDFILKSTGYYEKLSAVKPKAYTLLQNHPNPFNAGTTISYILRESGQVSLTIHNVLGQKVAGLVDGEQGPGTYAVNWDGRIASGQPAPSGLYFCRLQVGSGYETQKMVLMK